MNSVRKIIVMFSNPLTIELPREYENKKLEVIVSQVQDDENETSPDLSKFFGKLSWQGDALEEQKKIRNEWE